MSAADDRRPPRRWGPRGTAGAAIPSALSFAGVAHDYGRLRVLDGIDLAIAAGEVVCLLGQSGCGKTTLLRLAAGVERPTRGTIRLDAREVAGPERFVEPEDRGVGLMFQDYALFPHLSVKENVLFGLRHLAARDAETAAQRALSRVGMAHHAAAYPHQISGGEQQRVALARAVAPRPGVILMDEPFSNLDRRMRDAVREETVALLREMGATTVIVTHDPEEAMRIADRIVLMRSGRIVQAGTATTLYNFPADLQAARFFCDFNEADGPIRGGRVTTPLGVFPAQGHPDGTPAVVCIRPQGILLRAAGFCIPGRVVSRRFLGEVDLVEIAVQGLDQPLRARLRGHAQAVPGADVGVDIDPDEVLVFAAPAT